MIPKLVRPLGDKPPYPAEFREQMVDLHRAGRTIGEGPMGQ
jgi:hypothetical protein